MPVSQKIAFAAEIGLSGEVRPVSQIERRIAEAEKLGFEKIYISSYNQKEEKPHKKIKVIRCSTIPQIVRDIFQQQS